MFELDNSVRLVTLRFSFANPEIVPESVRHLDLETPGERYRRKMRSGGRQLLEPTEGVSLLELVSDLGRHGYLLVDAFHKPCLDKYNRTRCSHHAVSFVFVRRRHARISEEFKEARRRVRAELREMCRLAMWRVRIFLNPFFEDGEEVPGQCVLAVCLGPREPLIRPDGQPVMVWQRDESSNRVGDAPLPLQPRGRLRVINKTLGLVAYESAP